MQPIAIVGMLKTPLIVAVATLVAAPMAAQGQTWRDAASEKIAGGTTIDGRAIAVDGKTISLTTKDRYDIPSPMKIALWGVAAPDLNSWPWGAWSRAYLDILLRENKEVRCEVKSRWEDYINAQCFLLVRDKPADYPIQLDIGRQLIFSGYAVESRLVTGQYYADVEIKAREGKRGIWKDAPFGR